MTQLSQRDWEWLDYDNLREVAQNRIASMLIDGSLVGFFRVVLVQKAGPSKHEYLWPADDDMVQQYGFTEEQNGRAMGPISDAKSPDFFSYQADTTEFHPSTMKVDSVRSRVSLLAPLQKRGIILLLIAFYKMQRDRENQQNYENFLNAIDTVDTDLLDFIDTAALFTALGDNVDEAMDELVVAENQTEIQDWIERWVPASNQIAAGLDRPSMTW